jgi:tetratricopeptide (TPR) repeat protein
LRLERGLSQRELSSPGVSYAYISRIEAGARRPSVKALRMLAQKLGVTAEYLETGSQITGPEALELRLADAELRLRLDGDVPSDELREILADALEQSDSMAATRARVTLGLAAAARGDHREAIAELSDALRSDLVSPASRPDIYATLGHAYSAVGTPRLAAELFEQGLRELATLAPDDTASRVRFSSYLSYALTDLGDLEGARRVVDEALRLSEDTADPYTRIRLYWSLGRVAHEQEKPLVALEHFRRAVALLEATEDSVHLARASLSCAAAILAAGEEIDEAERQIDQAERLLGGRPELADLAVTRRLQSICATRSGAFAEGVRRAREAQEAAAHLPNQHALATWALAEALAGLRDAAAGDTFAAATEQLGEHGTVREHAQALRAYGRYLRDAGREGDALDVLDRAAEVAAGLKFESAAHSSL